MRGTRNSPAGVTGLCEGGREHWLEDFAPAPGVFLTLADSLENGLVTFAIALVIGVTAVLLVEANRG